MSGPSASLGERGWLVQSWRSWLIAAIIYAGWFLLTYNFANLPIWLILPLGALLIAWHGSLQHEAIHGQLAPIRWLNDLIAYPPLALWLPFPIYRHSHRAHHNFEILTEPWRDPESFYVDQATWQRLKPPLRAILVVHNTFVGRLLLGPFLVVGQFFWYECRDLVVGERRHARAWLWHLPAAALVLFWTTTVCDIPLVAYLGLFVFPGTSLLLIRSFAEHKAANTPYERTAVVEAGLFFSILFLNNNLHFAHHRRPDLPWHALPAYYAANKAELIRQNGGLLYRDGYFEIARRFLFRPIDRPAHPYI